MPTFGVLARTASFKGRIQEEPKLPDGSATERHEPRALFISCSDARLSPERLTSARAGELFVTRNVANIVPPFGTGEVGVGAVVEYAVLHLQVEHLVVCGHTDCGGIKALSAPLDRSREPHIARWIEHARPAATKVEASGLPSEDRHLATVRENVLLQLEHLRSYDPVREGERAGTLTLHGWVYLLERASLERFDPRSAVWVPLEEGIEIL